MKITKGEFGKWVVRYRDPSGRQRERSFARKADAETFGHQMESDKARGAFIDPNAGRITVAEYAAEWMAAQPHRASTADYYQRHLRNHVEPAFGRRQLASLRTTEVQGWVTSLTIKGLAPSTVGTIYGIFAGILRAAVRDDRLHKSPCVGIKLPDVPKTEAVVLEPAAVSRLADTITKRYAALVVLAAGTGMRQGEAFGLTTDSVHWLERSLTVDKSLSLVTGSGVGPVLGPTKTRASNRTIPLANHVIEALSVHVANYPAVDDLIFTNTVSGPIRRSSFNAAIWKPAVRRAGLPEHTTFHDLRHTFASLVIQEGATPKEVQSWMGHATISETFDTYGHLFPSADDNARRFIDAAFADSDADLLLTSRAADGSEPT